MTSDDVGMETMASVEMVGRTDNQGEEKVLILRRILNGGEIFRELIM